MSFLNLFKLRYIIWFPEDNSIMQQHIGQWSSIPYYFAHEDLQNDGL